ncbi:MAG: hypothetical protein ACLQMF_18710 [Rectinemataceae bacterium]
MTVAQRARIQRKIDRYKKALSDQKARFGAIDDSQGLRYEIPVLQMRLLDLTGALRYHTWFWKNIPDDIGDPLMYLAWTAMFYHRGELEKARNCLRSTLFSNLHLIPRVIGKPVGPYDMWYGSNIEEPLWLEGYDFRSLEFLTPAFLEWLAEEYRSDEITKDIAHFVELNRKFKDEPVGKSRTAIVEEIAKMQYGGRGSAS